jgi:hypothetical protein
MDSIAARVVQIGKFRVQDEEVDFADERARILLEVSESDAWLIVGRKYEDVEIVIRPRARMTLEEKLARLREIAHTEVLMRDNGTWYVQAYGRETQRRGSGILAGTYGDGRTPEEAVENDWEQIANLPPDRYVVLDAMSPKRRHVRWGGAGWIDLPVPRINA